MPVCKTRLIILDGIPGTGKTTGGEAIAKELSELGLPCQFYAELADNHPLRIYGDPVKFDTGKIKNWYVDKTLSLWSKFSETQIESKHISIIESWLFQDTVGWASRSGLGKARSIQLFMDIQQIISPLFPVLVYFRVTNVQSHLQKLCSIRGRDWGRQRLADEDGTCILAAKEFEQQQQFVDAIVSMWDIPKRMIGDRYFDWQQDGAFVVDALGIH